MTLGDISTQITFYTGADTTQYPVANRALQINKWYDQVQTTILRAQDSFDYDDSTNTDFPILTANLVANQQDYALPASSLQVKRLEVSYDAVNFYKASPFDINERGAGTATNNLGDFSQATPFYDVQYNSIFLYPIPSSAVTAGLKIWISRPHSDYTGANVTTGTAVPGFDSLFHDILALGASYDYAVSRNLTNREVLKRDLDRALAELANHYGSKDEDRVYRIGAEYESYGSGGKFSSSSRNSNR